MKCDSPSIKRPKIADNPADDDEEERLLLAEVREHRAGLEELDAQLEREISDLRRAYEAKKTLLFTTRAALIERMPSFWYRALTNHPLLSKVMTDEDRTVFKHLTRLTVTSPPITSTASTSTSPSAFPESLRGATPVRPSRDYAITMDFRDGSPFFAATSLTKTFRFFVHAGDENVHYLWVHGEVRA